MKKGTFQWNDAISGMRIEDYEKPSAAPVTEIGADYSAAVAFNTYIGNVLKQLEVEILSQHFARHRTEHRKE